MFHVLNIVDLPGDLVILRLVLAILGFLSCILVVFVAVRCYQNFKNSLSAESELETERLYHVSYYN